MFKKYLICVVGPTAVGKTSVAIKLAQTLKAEIISADSRQFYRELSIGTAKPTKMELDAAPHHFINSLSISDGYDVGQYEKEALEKLDEIFEADDVAVLVGGSGLFVNALCYGLDEFPEIAPEIREQLNQELEDAGLDRLNEELKQSDPSYYKTVDLKNPHRVIRALEVIRATGKPFSDFIAKEKAPRPFKVIMIGLELEREKLYQRIDARMDDMIEQGLFEEVEMLIDYRGQNALNTVGYKEVFGFLDGHYDREEAIRLLKRNSRRYAKRQLTWFKRDSSTTWFDPNDWGGIRSHVEGTLELPETED